MPEYYFAKDFLKDHALRSLNPVSGIALFPDYDGTLVPIQRDPSLCFPTEKLKEQLHTLAGLGRVRVTVLRGRGVTVRVGRSHKTSAQYYVKNHGEVERVLERIICGAKDL